MLLMGRTGVVGRSPRRLDRPASENLPTGPWCGRSGRCVPRVLRLGGWPGGVLGPRALIGDIPSSAGLTSWVRRNACVRQSIPADRRGLRSPQRPATHFLERRNAKTSPTGGSRRTGDERRPALGPHGIAHAHPSGRVHAARQERRRGLRHGLQRLAGGPEAPHVCRARPGGRTAVAAADPHWARKLHRGPGAPAFPPEARPWAGASALAQPQPLSVLSSPGPAAPRRPAAAHSTALLLPPGPGPPLAVPLPVSRSRRDRVRVRLAAREHRGPRVPGHIPECLGPPWTFQMMTRADSALSVLQAVLALEVMPSMLSIRSVVVCVATPASLVRGRLCWRPSASPRPSRL